MSDKATTARGASTTAGPVDEPVKTDQKPDDKAFAPIKPDDDDKNPVKVSVPKNAQEVAKEGTALGLAGADATGGETAFLSSDPVSAKRVWALDADHNVNLRNGGPGATQPDLVELGS